MRKLRKNTFKLNFFRFIKKDYNMLNLIFIRLFYFLLRYSSVFGASKLRSVVTIRTLPRKSHSKASDACSKQKIYLATFDNSGNVWLFFL